MSNGLLFTDWFLAILTTLCLLGHLAVLRAPDIPETSIVERIRWVKIAGLSIMTIRFWYSITTGAEIPMSVATQIGLSLYMVADFYGTMYRLFPFIINAQIDAEMLRNSDNQGVNHGHN